MKNVFRLLIFVIGVLSLSSCVVHNGSMNGSASLSQANFEYVEKSVSGSASTVRVLGIGGLGKKAIVETAKMNMLKDNPLKANQALANVTVNWKSGGYLLFQTNKCTVTADIIQFK